MKVMKIMTADKNEVLQRIKNIIKQDPYFNFNSRGSKYNQTSGAPWTIRWIRSHFDYKGKIADEQRVIGKEAIINYKIYKMIHKFAKQRAQYRYPLIANNTRDLGGYHTKDGYTIKAGHLIRSDNLHNLTKKGARFLFDHNINNVIDLRSESELDQAPDPNEFMNDGTRYFTGADLRAIVHKFPVFTNEIANESRPNTLKYGVIYRYGTIFVNSLQAKKVYYKSLKSILDTKGTLYHCVEGRDRTGILSVLLLSLLGVDKNVIFKDYLLTDYYAHTKPYVRQYEQLSEFYRVIDNNYNGILNYLKSIGITNADREQLRARFLK